MTIDSLQRNRNAYMLCTLFITIFLSLNACREVPLEKNLFDFQVEVLTKLPKNMIVRDTLNLVIKVHRNMPLNLPGVKFFLDYTTSDKGLMFLENKIEVLPQNNNIINNLDAFVIRYYPTDTGVHNIRLIVRTNFNKKVSETSIRLKADIMLYDVQYVNDVGGFDPFKKDPKIIADTITNNPKNFGPLLNQETDNTGAFVNEETPIAIYIKPSACAYTIAFNSTNNNTFDANVFIYDENGSPIIKDKPYPIKGGWTKFFIKLTDFLAKTKDKNGNGIVPLPITITCTDQNKSYPTSIDVRQTSEPIDLVISSIVDTTEGEVFTGKNQARIHDKKVLEITVENTNKSTTTNTYVAFKNPKMDVLNTDLSPQLRKNGFFYFTLPKNRTTFKFYATVKSTGDDTLKMYAYNDREITLDKEELVLRQDYQIKLYQMASISKTQILPTAPKENRREVPCTNASQGKRITYDVMLQSLTFGDGSITANDTKKVNIYIGRELVRANVDIKDLTGVALTNLNKFIGTEVDERGCGGTFPQLNVSDFIGIKDNYGNNLVVP